MGSPTEGDGPGPAPRRLLPQPVKGFLQGGLAAVVGGVCTHPLDLVKVRMQVSGLRSPLCSARCRETL